MEVFFVEWLVNLFITLGSGAGVIVGIYLVALLMKKFPILGEGLKKIQEILPVIQEVTRIAVTATEKIAKAQNLKGPEKKELAIKMTKDILASRNIVLDEKHNAVLEAAIESAVFWLEKQFPKNPLVQ